MRKFKKAAAIVTAAALTASACAPAAMADNFTDAGERVIEKASTAISENWDKDSLLGNTGSISAQEGIRITIGNDIRSLLTLTGMDFSWLNDISVYSVVKGEDGTFRLDCGISLNDASSPLKAYIIVDTKAMEAKANIPSLFGDAWIKINISDFVESNSFEGMMNEDFIEAVPDSEELQDLLRRYGNIVLNHASAEEAENDSVEAALVTQDAVLYKATYTDEEMESLYEEITAEAENDEVLQNLLSQIESFANVETTENPDFSSEFGKVDIKYWETEEGVPAGISFDLVLDEGESTFTLIKAEEEGKAGYKIEMGSPESSLRLEGRTEEDGEYEKGGFILYLNEKETAHIKTEEYMDKEAIRKSIRVTPADGLDEKLAQVISGYSVEFDYSKDSKDGIASIEVDKDEDLFVRAEFSHYTGIESEFPEISGPEYAFESEEDGEALAAAADLEGFMGALIDAGVPADFLASMMETSISSQDSAGTEGAEGFSSSEGESFFPGSIGFSETEGGSITG